MSDTFVFYFFSAGLAMNPDKSEVIVFITIRDKSHQFIKLLCVTVESGYHFKQTSIQKN